MGWFGDRRENSSSDSAPQGESLAAYGVGGRWISISPSSFQAIWFPPNTHMRSSIMCSFSSAAFPGLGGIVWGPLI